MTLIFCITWEADAITKKTTELVVPFCLFVTGLSTQDQLHNLPIIITAIIAKFLYSRSSFAWEDPRLHRAHYKFCMVF